MTLSCPRQDGGGELGSTEPVLGERDTAARFSSCAEAGLGLSGETLTCPLSFLHQASGVQDGFISQGWHSAWLLSMAQTSPSCVLQSPVVNQCHLAPCFQLWDSALSCISEET